MSDGDRNACRNNPIAPLRVPVRNLAPTLLGHNVPSVQGPTTSQTLARDVFLNALRILAILVIRIFAQQRKFLRRLQTFSP